MDDSIVLHVDARLLRWVATVLRVFRHEYAENGTLLRLSSHQTLIVTFGDYLSRQRAYTWLHVIDTAQALLNFPSIFARYLCGKELMMLLESVATALNLRSSPGGPIIGELRNGDLAECDQSEKEWVTVKVRNGPSAGMTGVVRRKWLIQHFQEVPIHANVDRSLAADIVHQRSMEYDAIRYALGTKARSWEELKGRGTIDCSGWVFLLAQEILKKYERKTKPTLLDTYSDEQITQAGSSTGAIVSGRHLTQSHFVPGVLVGIDFSEYSWDRGRPLDIDHIALVGHGKDGLVISQSCSSGGGVNTVPLAKWLESQKNLISLGRVHAVDLLSLA